MSEQKSGETGCASTGLSGSSLAKQRNWFDRNIWLLIKPERSSLTHGEIFEKVPLPKSLVFRLWLEEKAESLCQKVGLPPRSMDPPSPTTFSLRDVFSRRPTIL